METQTLMCVSLF